MRAARLGCALLSDFAAAAAHCLPAHLPVLQLDNEGHTLYVNNLFEKCSQDGAYCVYSAASRCPLLLRKTATVAAAAGCCPPAAHALPSLLGADLKKAMRCIFGQFGNILDVVSRRTYRLRGQVGPGGGMPEQ